MAHWSGSPRVPKSIIPKDIEQFFEEADIERTWEYLHKTFKVNVKYYKPLFEADAKTHDWNKVESFARFGKDHFEDAINKLAHRGKHTWFLLMRYMVRHKIEAWEKKGREDRKQYGVDSRYKTQNFKY